MISARLASIDVFVLLVEEYVSPYFSAEKSMQKLSCL